MKIANLARLFVGLMLVSMCSTVLADGDEGGAKEQRKSLMQEKRELAKKATGLRRSVLKENAELAEQVDQIQEEIETLEQKKENLILEASPELADAKKRMGEIDTELAELRQGDTPQKKKGGKKNRNKNKEMEDADDLDEDEMM